MLSGLLGSVLGFGGSVVPAITDHFKTKATNNKFELAKMEKRWRNFVPLDLTKSIGCMRQSR